ncbi:MAG: gliding motility-associated-like protein [Nonlabens sp.]|jgi:gliding motility-associated-like protein
MSDIELHSLSTCDLYTIYMKLFLLRKMKITPYAVALLFFVSFNAINAQCPTLPVSTQVICDAAGFDFNDLNAFATPTPGNSVRWYLNATGGTPLQQSQLVGQGTYYAGDSTGTCGTRPALVVDFTVDPSGQSLDAIFCSNESPTVQTYIDNALVINAPAGGSVQVFGDFALTNLLNPATALSGNTNYFIVFVDSGGCRSQIETGSTAVFPSPAPPTPPATQQFCSDTNPTIADLIPGTTANFNWFENVDVSNNPIPPALLDTDALVDGATYYVQADNFICESDPATVVVQINDAVDAGMSNSLEYCEDNIPAADFDLFPLLGPNADAGGAWTGPVTTSNGDQGTVNISGQVIGVYNFVYTVSGSGACPDETATVSIDILEILSSGVPSAINPVSFCVSQLPAAYDLTLLLDNEDTGGTLTQGTTSSDPTVTSPIDLTSFIPGTYDFTYSQNLTPNPCQEESTTVQVIVLADSNAGTSVVTEFCENDLSVNSPYDLFSSLDGSQDNNLGTWTDAMNNTVSNSIDITAFTLAGSPYNYTYTIDNGSCQDSETIVIEILPAPESGNYIGTPFTVCEDQAAANSPYDLFNLLDGTQDTNGTWYAGNTSAGTAVSNPIDLTTLGNGTFDFTYAVPAIGTCTDVDVVVTVIINTLTEAGTASTFVVCANELAANSPLDLFGQLSGQDAGGTWSDDDATGALTGNTVDLTALVVGDYNFTYTVTNGSCSDTSTVLVSVLDAPSAGTPTDLDICLSDISAGQTLDLFTQLTGNDAGGNWSDDDLTGELTGSILNISALTTGVYNFTYAVSPSAACSPDTETVQITINNINTPTALAIQDFCDQATVADLSAMGNAVIWYEDAALMNPLIGTEALLDGEDYFATQTDAITNCESNDSVAVTVNIFASPNSGAAVLLFVCNDQSMVDLFTALDGTQDASGTWIDTDATMALTGNIFDATAVVAGTYSFEYMVSATAPCTDASTIVMITVETPVDAGTDAVLDACTDNGTTDLFTLLGTATTGGTWSPALASGSGLFDPVTDLEATYTYTVTSSCNTSSADVIVSITEAPDAGTDNMISTCVSDGVIDLLTQLGGTPDATGTWFPLLDSGTNIFDPTVDVAGTYTYTVIATSPCATDASATLDIQVDESAAPTLISATLDFCATDNPIVMDLDTAVTGDMIVWYDVIDATIPLAATESLIDGTTYFASQTEANGCESSIRTEVMVNVGDAPTPTLDQDGELFCINDNPTLQQLTLNILEYDSMANNLVWYNAIDGTNALPLSTVLTSGTTYYAALIDTVTGCESRIRLEVTVDLSACGDLTIPDGFSPNGDGVNDTFDLDNLNFLYPNFSIEFYNRYGSRVYKGTANTPRFNGFSNQSALLSDGELPIGVYYYILKYNDGTTKPSQGRIYLSR